MKLRKFIATTIHEYLNEQQTIENNLNTNFWKWFGNSKVVEDDGTPMICYHHSEKSFNSFMKNKGYNSSLLAGVKEIQRHGFFFTPNKDFSKRYGKYEYACYLKVENPFNFKEHYFYKNDYPQYSELFDEFIEFAEENNIDLEYDYLTKSLNIPPDYNWQFLDDEIGEIFVNFLKSKGYDGVFFTEFYKEDEAKYSTEIQSIAVFNPNQIKSIKNIGKYDTNNDIYS